MIPREKNQKLLSYNDFKRKVFPLAFDKSTDEVEEVDFSQIEDIFSKFENKESTKMSVSAEELKNMNI